MKSSKRIKRSDFIPVEFLQIEKRILENIESILINDEVSTDNELLEFFQTEFNLSQKEVAFWVSIRDTYLNKFIITY